jgi:hypothetical protein
MLMKSSRAIAQVKIIANFKPAETVGAEQFTSRRWNFYITAIKTDTETDRRVGGGAIGSRPRQVPKQLIEI